MKRYQGGVVAIFAAAVLGLTGCGAGMGGGTGNDGPGQATGAFDWKRYDGEKITVMLNEHPWTDGVKDSIVDFEKATGITVDLKTYAEDLYFDKMNQALRTNSAPDLVMTGLDYSISTQTAAGLLEPLDDYVANTSLTESDYDLSDFSNGALAPATLPAGEADAKLYGLPISTETYILFYNKDLVDKYLGGTAPTTMDQLIADAEKITREGGGKEDHESRRLSASLQRLVRRGMGQAPHDRSERHSGAHRLRQTARSRSPQPVEHRLARCELAVLPGQGRVLRRRQRLQRRLRGPR